MPRPLVRNGESRAQNEHAKAVLADRLRRFEEATDRVLTTDDGIVFLHGLMERCKGFTSLFDSDPYQTAHNTGLHRASVMMRELAEDVGVMPKIIEYQALLGRAARKQTPQEPDQDE